jgi:hypothetical protein
LGVPDFTVVGAEICVIPAAISSNLLSMVTPAAETFENRTPRSATRSAATPNAAIALANVVRSPSAETVQLIAVLGVQPANATTRLGGSATAQVAAPRSRTPDIPAPHLSDLFR